MKPDSPDSMPARVARAACNWAGRWALFLGIAAGGTLFATASQNDDVGALIRQLDSQDFGEREAAMSELAQLGETAVEPLARAYFTATSEQRWRILAVLRSQAVAGDEAGFYRIAAILRTLGYQRYDAATITSLHQLWQAGRSERAAERLLAAGAVVTAGFDSIPEEFLDDTFGLRMAQQAMMRVVDEPQFPVPLIDPDTGEPATAEVASADSPAGSELSAAQRQQQVEALLSADIDEHRRVAMRPDSGKQAATGEPAQLAASRNGVFQIEGGVIVELAGGDFGLVDPAFMGGQGARTVLIGPEWKGGAEQLADLSSIEQLFLVRFDSRPELTPEQLLMVARSPSLSALSVIRTPVSAEALEVLPELTGVTLLELDLGAVDPAWIDVVRKMPGLGQLRLRSDRLLAANLAGIENVHSLRHLMLENVELAAGDFSRLETLPFLVSLNLKCCRFDVAEFRAFTSRATQLKATTTGNSFLGVRGPSLISDLEGGGCQISETVPGAAAETAGVQAGDLIRSIDGVEIRAFEDLTLVISQRQPGDSITLEILRGSETLKLPVILGNRKDAPIR